MKALTSAEILTVWEEGDGRHPLDRALLPLAAALPDWSWDELAALSVGRRDGLLLRLRAQTLGDRIEMLATCPHCRELMEFETDAAELAVCDAFREPGPPPPLAGPDGQATPVRRLTSQDLARAVGRPRGEGRARLAAASLGRAPNSAEETAAVAQALADADPQAEILFSLTCPACEHSWSALFDIADYFWREIAGLAKRLLDDVRELAVHYGWSEAEVVAMSPVRRRHYLERARAS